MRAQLYNLVSAAMPESVRHVDLWNEQLLNAEDELPFNTPAVLIEFADIKWTQQLHGVRDADVELRLHVITDSRLNDWNSSLNNLAIADSIAEALHGLHNQAGIDSLTLVGSHTDHNFDELRDDIETYHCHITSTSNSASQTATVRHVTTSVTPD